MIKLTNVLLVTGSKRKQLEFSYLKYIYIPLSPEEIKLLELGTKVKYSFRITVEDK